MYPTLLSLAQRIFKSPSDLGGKKLLFLFVGEPVAQQLGVGCSFLLLALSLKFNVDN